jgi:pyruvate dehydrogenase E1 component alpha subunit
MSLVLQQPTTATTVETKYSKETYLAWFETMLRIRRFEERALMMYSQKKIRGFCHVYIGQEAVAGGMVSACRQTDPWISGYRVHGLALAKGVPSRNVMAELYGKATGNVGGRGGSMHFYSKELCLFGGDGIVGGQIPNGAGIALAEQYKGTDNATLCLFGDGAARQGALYETFNMAMTWKLPVIFICENNGYAMGTSVERTSNVTDLYKIGAAFDMPSRPVNGMDVEAVHEALTEALEHVRAGKGPYYLEMKTYRYKGHSVSDPGNYRSKEEVNEYKEVDPVKVIKNKVLDLGIATPEEVKEIENKIKAEIEDAANFADESPYPDAKDLYKYNYYMDDNYPYLTHNGKDEIEY